MYSITLLAEKFAYACQIGGRPRQRCDDIGGQRTLLQRGTGWRQGDGRA
eukprot:COSAG06_NODE_859_length_11882_cov_31.614701_16_plen_48_part_01